MSDGKPLLLVIINNAAARARRAWPSVKASLIKQAVAFDAHETTRAGDATCATRKALQSGYNLIAVLGGDGTLSEAAEGFFELPEGARGLMDELPSQIKGDVALALLPAGTGDDFARGLTGRRESLERWLEALIKHCLDDSGKTRMIDVMYGSADSRASCFISLNVATIGLGAEVAMRVAAQTGLVRRLSGEARFVSASCAALIAWRERRVRLTIDDENVIECSSNLLAVANGIYAGGGMMFAPDASVDDGRLEVLAACGINRLGIVRELPRIRRGAHLSNPNVHTFQGTRVRIETLNSSDKLPIEADGNVRGHTPVEFRVMPGALRLLVP